jgi:putative SOS response-associated peptidase YedK
MFLSAIKRRRCLFLADGFYEWQDVDGTKLPWCARMRDGARFAFGGIWEHWTGATGDEIQSAALITTNPNSLMEPIHDRMPVIINPDNYDAWLDPGTPLPDALAMLKPYEPELMRAYRVGKAVGSVKAEGPELIEPIAL